METHTEKFFLFIFSSDKDFWKNKWKLRTWKNKAMVNCMLGAWEKVTTVTTGKDGDRSRELNFLSTIQEVNRFFKIGF